MQGLVRLRGGGVPRFGQCGTGAGVDVGPAGGVADGKKDHLPRPPGGMEAHLQLNPVGQNRFPEQSGLFLKQGGIPPVEQ